MKYETKNNIGILLLIFGSVGFFLALMLLQGVWMYLAFVLAGIALAIGFYLMMLGFTDRDKDHPDYHRFDRPEEK